MSVNFIPEYTITKDDFDFMRDVILKLINKEEIINELPLRLHDELEKYYENIILINNKSIEYNNKNIKDNIPIRLVEFYTKYYL